MTVWEIVMLSVIGVAGWVIIGSCVSAVITATNWFGMRRPPERRVLVDNQFVDRPIKGVSGVFDAEAVAIAVVWPSIVAIAVIVGFFVGMFILPWKGGTKLTRALTKRLNPEFEDWRSE